MTGLQISILFLSVALMLVAFFIAFVLLSNITANRRAVTKRMDTVRGKQKGIFDNVNERHRKHDKKSLEAGKKKGSFLKKWGLLDAIFEELLLAGIMMKPEEFCVLWLVLVFVPSGLFALFSANLLSSVVLAIIGAVLPIVVVKQKKKKRTEIFESQLGDALLIICNCLRSGLTFQQAMDTIAKEMSPPMNMEFARTLNEIRFGNSTEQALNNMAERLKSADLMLAISAVNIQRQTGGNLSEILESISTTIKDRFKIKSEIKGMTAQGRMSGLIIGLLPIGISAVLLVINPDYMSLMFTEPLGNILLVVAAVMEIMGFLVIKKIITIKY